MNKITSILAGLATVAAVSVAPAFAQGNLFSPPGTFTFMPPVGGVLTVTGSGEKFNLIGGPTVVPVSFTLIGTAAAGFPGFYNLTSLTIMGTGVAPTSATPNTFTELGPLGFSVQNSPSGTTIASTGAAPDGTTFNLVSAPVPEASTTVSFGALLALGGLALVLRRKSVKNAA